MKFLYLIILLILSSYSTAQKLQIRQDYKAPFVNRIDNYLMFLGKMKNSYVVSTDNGIIVKSSIKNNYLLHPNKAGKLQILVSDKFGKLIYKENFRVKEIEFDVDFYGLKSGINDVNIFLNHNHLQLLSDDLVCLDFQWQWTFEVIHIKQNEKYIIIDIEKSKSLKPLKDKLKDLEKGDILIFKNIKIYFQDIEYSIKDKVVYVN